MEKINIAELLRNCPEGMELDCVMFNDVKFIDVEDNDKPICIKTGDIYRYLTKFGTWTFDENAKCVIFPKGETTWEGFQRPFKDGDIVACSMQDFIGIAAGDRLPELNTTPAHCILNAGLSLRVYAPEKDFWYFDRLATEEEKEKLFKAIKDNGYKWNEETKTLEKLVEPKFKVGDRIKSVMSSSYYTVVDIKNNNYLIKSDTEKHPYQVSFENEINYKLVPDKFDITTLKPFESRVLVRDCISDKWLPAIWGFYNYFAIRYHYECIGCRYNQCIPYEGNEHLLGKTDDCDEFYKTWE